MQTSRYNAEVELTSGKLIARNTVFNLIGRIAPLFVALVAIPILIRDLGLERFGVLTLAWMLVGYFSLFDLGVGRALTKMVAEKLGASKEKELPQLIWTTLFLMFLLGAIGALIVGFLSPWLVHRILKIPFALQSESLNAFTILAISIPIVISSTGLRGVLEAYQRFGLVNIVRAALGLFTYLGPILILFFANNLALIVAALVTGRVVAWLAYLIFCLRLVPDLQGGWSFQSKETKAVIKFGGWITVSNVVSPLMVYLDRFLIGALVSITAVAYYVTPYDVVTRLWAISGAVTGVMFPVFSISFVQDGRRTALLFSRAVKSILLLLFPITLIIIAFAQESLNLWLGEEFAQNSTFVLQCLTLGVFVNSLSHIPSALIQGIGRPDLTAKLHLLELPFYLIGVWWMIAAFGIKGAAIAWLVRVMVDTAFLFGFARRLLAETASNIQRMGLIFGGSLVVLTFAMLPMGIVMSGIFVLLLFSFFLLTSWFFILDSEERLILRGWLS